MSDIRPPPAARRVVTTAIGASASLVTVNQARQCVAPASRPSVLPPMPLPGAPLPLPSPPVAESPAPPAGSRPPVWSGVPGARPRVVCTNRKNACQGRGLYGKPPGSSVSEQQAPTAGSPTHCNAAETVDIRSWLTCPEEPSWLPAPAPAAPAPRPVAVPFPDPLPVSGPIEVVPLEAGPPAVVPEAGPAA